MDRKLLSLLIGLTFVFVSKAQITTANLQASGLTCAICAKSIYKNLSSLVFVDKVDIDLNASTFLITFKKDADVDIDLLNTMVQDAGFSIASLHIVLNLGGANIANDVHLLIGKNMYHFLDVKPMLLVSEVSLRVIDQGFITSRESKKYVRMTKMQCISNGNRSSCCPIDGVSGSSRIFHVTI